MDEQKSIRIFLLDGTVTGRIKASIMGWTGVVFKIPRSFLKQTQDRKELQQTGVYLLFGESENRTDGCIYVGQASERVNGKGLLQRLYEHNRNPEKDYFDEVYVITTTDNSLGATEISYLENHFYKLALEIDRYEVKNDIEPASGNLTEEIRSEIDSFAENVKLLVGILGHKAFQSLRRKSPIQQIESNTDTDIVFSLSGPDADAKMQQTDEGFLVLKGSRIRFKNLPDSCPASVKIRQEALGSQLTDEGVLETDVLFSSPSSAAAFCLGRNANGRQEWKDQNKIKLEEYLNKNS